MLRQQIVMPQELFQHQPARAAESARDAEHAHRSEEVQRPRQVAQQEAYRNQIEEYSERSRDPVVRHPALAVHIADRHFNDRSPVPGSQRRNKPVQFAVQRNLLQNRPPVRLEGGAEVMDIDAAELGHHPVRHARRQTPKPEIVDALLAPPAYDVIALGDLLEEHRDVVRVVLQVPVHGNDVLAAGVVEASRQAGGLPKVPPQLHHRHPAVHRRDFTKQRERAILRAVIYQDNLETLAMALHDRLQAIVEVGHVFLFVVQRYDNGVLRHGKHDYTRAVARNPLFLVSGGTLLDTIPVTSFGLVYGRSKPRTTYLDCLPFQQVAKDSLAVGRQSFFGIRTRSPHS